MKFLRETTPFTQIIFTLITILMGGIVISIVGFLGCRIFLGISFEDLTLLLTNYSNPDNIGILKFFQVLQTIGMFILPPVILAFSLDNQPYRYLQMDRIPSMVSLGLVAAVILVSGPLIEWFALINQQLVLPSWLSSLENWMRNSEDQAGEITKAFLATKSLGGLLGNILVVAVLPAIGEELLFRGILQKMIKSLIGSSHGAIWITAILFSALHLQFFGFLPRMLLGVLFGYLLEWTGSLWLPILAHFINNAAGVLIYFFTGEGLEPDKADTSIFANSLFCWALASGVILWFLLHYLYLRKLETNSDMVNPK